MYSKGALVLCVFFTIQSAISFPIGLQSPLTTPCNGFNQRLAANIPEAIVSSTPIITEIVPSLHFGDITVTGDLPVGGNILVKGRFPVYGSVAIDGGLPSAGTAVVNIGNGVMGLV